MDHLRDFEAARRYVEAVAPATGLALDASETEAVALQVQVMAGLFALLPDDLPDTLEPAPRFEPRLPARAEP